MQKTVVLFGPTASGKTEIIRRLFTGPHAVCPAEIVSADSMQVYRGMDIGTAKPSAEERAAVAHHLIDIRDPSEPFDAGAFVHLAAEACRDIAARGKLPVVSGGTGFYLKNLILGLPDAPPSEPAVRRQVKADLAERGAEALFAELQAADPASAARIHPNDIYRLTRAVEVFRLTGRPLSSFAQHKDEREATDLPLILGLRRDREDLYRRIDARCRAMFEAGLGAEVERLFAAGYTPADPGMRAIGYREFFQADGGGTAGAWRLRRDLDAVQAEIAANSRRYAKRQITFFARLPGVTWINCGEGGAAEKIRAELENLAAAPGMRYT